MHSKKVVIVAQIFISGMMALLMTAFFAIIHLGFTVQMLSAWGNSFTIAWPVAFCLSLFVSPVAFMMSIKLVGKSKIVEVKGERSLN